MRMTDPASSVECGVRGPARAWLGGCFLSRIGRRELLDLVLEWARAGREARTIIAVHVSKLVTMQRDEKLAQALLSSDVNIADGFPVYAALRLLGDPIPERITGIDLMMDLLALAHRECLSVYFLGARPEVLARTAAICARDYPGARMVGMRDGYFPPEQEREVVKAVAAASPDLLFVGLGFPQKEYFVLDHRANLGAGVVLPVGGGFDILAGMKKRAPGAVQRIGLEWLWRSLYDPSKAGLVRRSFLPFASIVAREFTTRRRSHAES
jgi:N-acetylglucosaminyldiphosphoundecaprenol N-acetyl-beta-D-mannosaminyltransferase